ncbi:hypothetical protein [Burkholderia sp. PU8-34]
MGKRLIINLISINSRSRLPHWFALATQFQREASRQAGTMRLRRPADRRQHATRMTCQAVHAAGINGPLLRTWISAAKQLTKPKTTPNYSFDFPDSQGANEIRESIRLGLLFQDETKRNNQSAPDYCH